MSGVYVVGFIVFFTSYFTTFDESQVVLSEKRNPVTYDYVRPWIKSMIVGLVSLGALLDDRVGKRRRKIEEEETKGHTQEEWIRQELEKGKKQ